MNRLNRLIEIVVASLGLLLAFPLMLLIGLFIKLSSRGPVLYRFRRVDQCGKTVNVLRFRTMRYVAPVEPHDWAVSDDPRVTSLGRYLRKYSLDHLPLLFEILKGNVSLRSLVEEARDTKSPLFTRVTSRLQLQRRLLSYAYLVIGAVYWIARPNPSPGVLVVCGLFVVGLIFDSLLIHYRYLSRVYGNDPMELMEIKEFLATQKHDYDNAAGGGKVALYPEREETEETASEGATVPA